MQAEVTADGSAVEVYRRLPPGAEAELIDGALEAGASVLERTSRATSRSR